MVSFKFLAQNDACVRQSAFQMKEFVKREFVYIGMQIIPKSRDSFCRSFLTYFCNEGVEFPPNVSL